ncbi:MAG: hypothetical protein M3P53_02045, partial [Actinomycetota bacterium]|nr:hypothetical protein [Actinomycetota bacterium]
ARIDQDADVDNEGHARANTGDNVAIGNASDNDADNDQDARAGDGRRRDGDRIATNDAVTSNNSDGTAIIETGDATAFGNHSTTNVGQLADVDGEGRGGFARIDQDADVDNEGHARANTGDNVAIGNASDNDADNDQDARAGDGRRRDGDRIATNDAVTSNDSDGTATIETGDAHAVGNLSATDIEQVADVELDGGDCNRDCDRDRDCKRGCDRDCKRDCKRDWKKCDRGCDRGFGRGGFARIDQDADVDNEGRARANTGGNVAIGNASDNDADNDQRARARRGGIATNTGEASNDSDGTADVATGDAKAIGNLVGHRACQGDNTPSCPKVDLDLPDVPKVPDLCDKDEDKDNGQPPGDNGQPPVDNGRPPIPENPRLPVTPVVSGVTPVVSGVNGQQGEAAALAVTGVSVAVQIVFGLLLLAFGFFLRRKGQTA